MENSTVLSENLFLQVEGRYLQIFEVFQVFKRPPGDPSYMIVVEEAVKNTQVIIRLLAVDDAMYI